MISEANDPLAQNRMQYYQPPTGQREMIGFISNCGKQSDKSYVRITVCVCGRVFLTCNISCHQPLRSDHLHLHHAHVFNIVKGSEQTLLRSKKKKSICKYKKLRIHTAEEYTVVQRSI